MVGALQRTCALAEICPQYAATAGMFEAANGLFLDLAYAFSGEVELLADLLQCVWLVALQTEVQSDHVRLTDA